MQRQFKSTLQRQRGAPCRASELAPCGVSSEHPGPSVQSTLQATCPASDKRCVMALSPTPGTLSEPAAASGDRVSDLIQKLVAAATAEVESAAQRTRAQAQI